VVAVALFLHPFCTPLKEGPGWVGWLPDQIIIFSFRSRCLYAMHVPTTPHSIPAGAEGELRRKSSGSFVARVCVKGSTVDTCENWARLLEGRMMMLECLHSEFSGCMYKRLPRLVSLPYTNNTTI
jgi:hypothetical protein